MITAVAPSARSLSAFVADAADHPRSEIFFDPCVNTVSPAVKRRLSLSWATERRVLAEADPIRMGETAAREADQIDQ